jgi:hypothetical protein
MNHCDELGGANVGRMLSMVALLCLVAGAVHAEVLITPEEAARPPVPANPKITIRAVSRPPTVDIDYKPAQTKPLTSPLTLSVKFTAHGGAKVDAGSVKVVYLRNPELDLTPRLKKYIDATGINMPSAEVPPGEHAIRIELKDSSGRENTTVIQLIVKPGGA